MTMYQLTNKLGYPIGQITIYEEDLAEGLADQIINGNNTFEMGVEIDISRNGRIRSFSLTPVPAKAKYSDDELRERWMKLYLNRWEVEDDCN